MRASCLCQSVLATSITICSVDLTAVEVTEENANVVIGKAATVTPVSRWTYVGYPEVVGMPMFWLDAADRDAWSFSPTCGTQVTRIPSKTGTRALVVAVDSQHVPSDYVPAEPTLVTGIEGLGGGTAVDFGALGSGQAMFFDVVGGEHKLENIGTVIAVMDSSATGGQFLGGSADVWGRGTNRGRTAGTEMFFDNPVFAATAETGAAGGFVRHNGVVTRAADVGFAGTWEVVSFMPSVLVSSASGVATGCDRGTSGGQRIAELLIYDKQLTMEECEKVEAYLRAKWFPGDLPAGVNGRSYARRIRAFENIGSRSTGAVRFTVDTPRDTTLAVGCLNGGRGASSDVPAAPAMVKAGAGTLELGEASSYGGTVELAAGTLAFENRAIPDALPPNCSFHFDASAEGSVKREKEEGVEYVTAWSNLNATACTVQGEPVRGAYATSPSTRPVYVPDALGPGKPAVDFGPALQNATGCFLRLGTQNGATLPDLNIAGAVTYIAVVETVRGGGNVVDMQAVRRANVAKNYYGISVASATTDIKLGTETLSTVPQVYLNGAPWQGANGYETPAFEVVSAQSCGANSEFGHIGCNFNNSGTGGFKLAELLVYRRVLSEREIRDAHAYLMQKWFGRSAPGYDQESSVPDLQTVYVTSDAEIRIARGTTRIRYLELNGALRKTGAGTLEVETLVQNGHSLLIKEGDIRIVEPVDPETISELAKDASFHLDMSRPEGLTTVTVDGTNFVMAIVSADGRSGVYQYSQAYMPWIDPARTLGGVPVLNFGTFGTSSAADVQTGSRFMTFAKALDGIRSVFLVWGTQEGGGQVLGSASALNYDVAQGGPYDFMAPAKGASKNQIFDSGAAAFHTGTVLTNGVDCKASTVRSGDYALLETHVSMPLYSSALCLDRGSDNNRGGQRLAEVVVYERVLSEREKTATRNYLMQKWFGKEPDPTAFPKKDPHESGILIPDPLVVEGSASVVVTGGVCTVKNVNGSGNLVKRGDGVLSLRDLSDLTGTLQVADGTVRLTGWKPPVLPAMADEGLSFRLDAGEGIKAVTNANGTIEVSEWASAVPGSGKAVAINHPQLRLGDLNGRPVVDMTKATRDAFWFYNADGEKQSVSNICSALWVVGSQEGGGWLLGGGARGYAWHRGKSADAVDKTDNGTDPLDPIISTSAASATWNSRNIHWYLNGEAVEETTTGLSGAWDQVSYVCDTNANASLVPLDAHGLAMDSRMPGSNDRSGHQRLAELAIYDRVLTDDERVQSEVYLDWKWGLKPYTRLLTNAVAVALASGTTLDCGGTNQYVAAISGCGQVTNGGIETPSLVYDFGVGSCLDVDGAFVLSEGFRITLSNLPEPSSLPLVSEHCILSSADIRETFRLVDSLAECGIPEELRAKLIVKTDGLYLCLKKKAGFAILVR